MRRGLICRGTKELQLIDSILIGAFAIRRGYFYVNWQYWCLDRKLWWPEIWANFILKFLIEGLCCLLNHWRKYLLSRTIDNYIRVLCRLCESLSQRCGHRYIRIDRHDTREHNGG